MGIETSEKSTKPGIFGWGPWAFGLFLLALFLIGLAGPAIPFLGAIVAAIVGFSSFLGVGATMGTAVMAGVFFITPPAFISLGSAKQNAGTAASVLLAFLKAAAIAVATVAAGYFLMPFLMGLLAGAIGTSLGGGIAGFLVTLSHTPTSTLSFVMLGVSGVSAFGKSLYGSAFADLIRGTTLKRGAEFSLGMVSLGLSLSFLLGALPAVPLMLPIALGFVSALSFLGFFTTMAECFGGLAKDKPIDLSSFSSPGSLHTPDSSPAPGMEMTSARSPGPAPSTVAAPSHPLAAANASATAAPAPAVGAGAGQPGGPPTPDAHL